MYNTTATPFRQANLPDNKQDSEISCSDVSPKYSVNVPDTFRRAGYVFVLKKYAPYVMHRKLSLVGDVHAERYVIIK